MVYGNEDVSRTFNLVLNKIYMEHRIMIINGFHEEKKCKWCIYLNEKKSI